MRVRKVHCQDIFHFYRYWLEVLCLKVSMDGDASDVKFPNGREHHILTSRQMDLLAVMLKNRHELEKKGKVRGDDMLDMVTTGEQGRAKIRKELGIVPQRMYELLKGIESKPEKILIRVATENGKLDYYRINPKYMPVVAPTNEHNVLTDLVIRFVDG